MNKIPIANHDNTLPRKKDDPLLKAAFEELFPYLLRFCFPGADNVFDFRKGFVFLDKELTELFPELKKHGGSRFVDMLVKTFLKNGKEEWILVHIEIQGGSTKGFPKRMFQYWYRIYDRYGVDITALAIFTGSKRQQHPGTFHKTFMGTEIIYRYNAYHIFDHSEAELLAMDNPFALIVLAAQKALLQGKVPEEELANHRLTVARALIQRNKFSHKRIEKLLFFLKNFIYIGNEEINRKFDKQIEQLTGGKVTTMGIIETIKKIERDEGIEIGREKGIEEGIEKGKQEVIENLIIKLGLSDKQVADIAEMPVSFVKKVRASLKKRK
jgi:predicted transposase YdaD